jgi:hypothetical protein
MTKQRKAEATHSEPRIPQALRQALDALLNLDIPAKGRIAHHIRMGRFNRALALCATGQHLLWQKVWERSAPAMLEQVRLLSQVELILRGAMDNGKSELIGGTY